MDKLLEYVNGNATYNATMVYSTLADYIGSVNALNLTWPLETPDFFTYVDRPHAWWSGYFTSRPMLKLYTRSRQNQQRVTEQFYLFAKCLDFTADFPGAMRNISKLRDAVAVTQHHDAITGTEKDFVAEEYLDQMRNDTIDTNYFLESVVGQFFAKEKNGKTPTLQRNIDTLMTQLTANNLVVMPVYNSLPWRVTEFLRVPSNRSDIVIYDDAGKLVPSQIIPVMTQAQPFAYPAKYQMFVYTTLAPLAFSTYFIGINPNLAQLTKPHKGIPGEIVGKGYYSLQFDSTSGLLTGIRNNAMGRMFAVQNQWSQYVPSGGIYDDGLPRSGAYLFRPAQDSRYLTGHQNNRQIHKTLIFRQPLTSSKPEPGFITTTRGQDGDYLDTFHGQVCNINVNKNQFEFEYYRVDRNSGWSQNPYFDWAVFDASDPTYGQLFSNSKTGSMSVSRSSTATAMVTIDFGSTFGSTVPRLLASVRTTSCDGSQYSKMVTAVTATSATVYISRIDSNSAWTQNIFIDWVAFEPAQFPNTQLQLQGQSTLSVQASSKSVSNFSITLPTNDFYVFDPIILVSAQQISPSVSSASDVFFYSLTAYDNTNETFQVRVFPHNPSGSGNVQLQVTFMVFERYALQGVVTDDVTYHIEEGELVTEVQQFFRDNYAQSWRVWNVNDSDLQYIDNQVHIGPIDQGAELVTRFATELKNDLTWYSNQAALEYVKRVYFPYWDEPIAGNYYPAAGQAYLEDSTQGVRFVTIVNQGHGVGCLREGEMELMLQRRCLEDDQRGVGEVLNTTHHTEPSIFILLGESEDVAYLSRRLYLMQQFPHNLFWGMTDSIAQYTGDYNTTWNAMNADYKPDGFPPNIFLMQLRYAYSGNDDNEYSTGIIMQLQNMFEMDESKQYSVNETVNLNDVIDNRILTITSSTEMTLTGNLPLADMHRLPWNVQIEENGEVIRIRDAHSEEQRRKRQREIDASLDVNLFPRAIRTFVVNEDSHGQRQGWKARQKKY
jgi:hypothetical protein